MKKRIEILIKVALFGLGIVLALMCLHGCFVAPINPSLTVSVSPDKGHPPFDITIAVACSKEGGTYTLNVKGKEPVESNEGAFTATIIDWPWRAAVTWVDELGGFSEAPVVVKLENEIPVAHGFHIPETCAYHQLVVIDLRYRPIGCTSSGVPEFYNGIEDPDYTNDGYSMENDGFTYNVQIFNVASGRRESVFYGPNRILMGDEYVENPIFYWFVTYSGAEPIIPYPVWSPAGEVKSEKAVHVYVMEFGTVRHWVYTVFATPSGCL